MAPKSHPGMLEWSLRNGIVFAVRLLLSVSLFLAFHPGMVDPRPIGGRGHRGAVISTEKTIARLKGHLEALTQSIGERSVRIPQNLDRTADYIESFYRDLGLAVKREPYGYRNHTVFNIVAKIAFSPNPSKRYLLGAHYDSVSGTVGADDNASAIAVQLETARHLKELEGQEPLDLEVVLVSFPLEEPPVYGTRHMGSRVYAKKAREEREQVDGMICLEMVGYTCNDPHCQGYPFPLKFFGYPDKGDFIGIVGNWGSRRLTDSIFQAFQRNPELPVIKLNVPLAGWLLPSVRLSDHASFWDEGFEAVMITDSAYYRNPNYHQFTDTMEKLDLGFMAELVESLLIFFRSTGR